MSFDTVGTGCSSSSDVVAAVGNLQPSVPRSVVDLTGADTEEDHVYLSSHSSATERPALFPLQDPENEWYCPACTLQNNLSSIACLACGRPRSVASPQSDVEGAPVFDADDAEIERLARRETTRTARRHEQAADRHWAQPTYDPWTFHHNYLSPNHWPGAGVNVPGECMPFWSLFNVDFQPRVLTGDLVLPKSGHTGASGASLSELPAEAILSSYGMDHAGILLPLLRSGLHASLVVPYDHNQQTPHIDSEGLWLDLDEDEETPLKSPVRLQHFPNVVTVRPPMLNHMLAAKYRPHIKRTKEARVDRAVWTTGPVATTMHSKLILIRFAHHTSSADTGNWMQTSRVRVVVTSANISRYDWYCLDQNVWVQDFFPSAEASSGPPTSVGPEQIPTSRSSGSCPVTDTDAVQDVYVSPTMGDFKRQLRLVLESFMIPSETRDRFLSVSFHNSCVDLVASIPGVHKATPYEGWLQAAPPASASASLSSAPAPLQAGVHVESNVLANVGINRLQTLHRHYTLALEHLHCPLHAMPRKLMFQMSSVGALSQSFLWTLVSACLGSNVGGGLPPHKPAAGSGTKRKREVVTAQAPITLLWPSFAHANSTKFRSPSGSAYGATHLMLSSNTWKRAGFPRSNFSDYTLTPAMARSRASVLSHCKLLYPEWKIGTSPSSTPPHIVRMWLYAGSANASMAAWGSRQSSDTQLRVGNHELGVLFPPVARLRMRIPTNVVASGGAVAWARQRLESLCCPEAESACVLVGEGPSNFPLYYEPVASLSSSYQPWLHPDTDAAPADDSDTT